MFCRNCGRQISDGASFCTSCGAQVTPPAARPSPVSEMGSAGWTSAGSEMGSAARPYPSGSPDAAVATARARRANNSKNVKMAIIIIAAVAVVAAVAAFAMAPSPGGGAAEDAEEQEIIVSPDAVELAQMSGEEAGKVLSGMTWFSSGDGSFGYATSEELAEVVSEDDVLSDAALGKMSLTDGSVVWAFKGDKRNEEYATAEEVSSGDDIAGYSQVRKADDMPSLESLKDIVRGLGANHMLVVDYDLGKYDSMVAFYTIGDDIFGEIAYYYPNNPFELARTDYVRYSQGDVSIIDTAIKAGATDGTKGVISTLTGKNREYAPAITNVNDLLYYE